MNATTVLVILQVIKVLQEIKEGRSQEHLETVITNNLKVNESERDAILDMIEEIDWGFVGKILEGIGQIISSVLGNKKEE